jgi:hypothetical protein
MATFSFNRQVAVLNQSQHLISRRLKSKTFSSPNAKSLPSELVQLTNLALSSNKIYSKLTPPRSLPAQADASSAESPISTLIQDKR